MIKRFCSFNYKYIIPVSVILLTSYSYAFFADWAQMPMNMMQMTQPQQQVSPLVC